MINLKKLKPNNGKVDEESHKNTFICHTGYVTFKFLNYATIISINP